ncbi:olfactory receptor 11L1-like [Leptodactylus fuscus]|uniref:olfactory receptor 11L1-like n=1 Tax=Leptodactylus fuscus TaxID=238119 RepID=UPI003F4EF8AC
MIHPKTISFLTISFRTISFLDIEITLSETGELSTTLFRKETATNALLRYDSHHPQPLKKGIPKGQFLRVRRNCSELAEFDRQSEILMRRFLDRGYPRQVLETAYRHARDTPRDSLLTPKPNKEKDNTIRLIGTFDKHTQETPRTLLPNMIIIHLWDHRRTEGKPRKQNKEMNTEAEQLSDEKNLTAVTEFFILGFQVSQDLRILLFCLLLVVYCGTICGNLLIITLVSTSKILHTPMYFFIAQLSITDILLPTDIVPNLLHVLLNNGAAITLNECFTQFYFFCSMESFECLLLAVMSYDRYVAICNPLRYTSIMTSGHCGILTLICWLIDFSFTLALTIIEKLNFCGHNIIDHVFCDLVPLLELTCSDTFIIHLEMYLLGIPIIVISTTIIVVFYTCIVRAVLRISSSTGRQKAFSTCSSHLIVVSIFYGTIFTVYVVPTKGLTLSMGKILSLLYTVFTPLVNPIIYSLRNKDIWKAIQEAFQKYVFPSISLVK